MSSGDARLDGPDREGRSFILILCLVNTGFSQLAKAQKSWQASEVQKQRRHK